ncbi:diacylglycerol/lipid kinase family protein [Bounagaea algeriensis]
MRAILVVNPQATATTAAGRDVLAHALASELELDVVQTRCAGHAAETARTATREGADVLIAHGGDGTVNEVVNGMLAERAPGDPALPLLGVVPGGSANVFARALGTPRDPIEATHWLLRALHEGRSRWVSLGRADERWFTFNAGLGWDAEVVAAVERHRQRGRPVTPGLYARTALERYLHMARCAPMITVRADDTQPVDSLHSVFVANTDPWTYFGSRPVRLSPGTSFDDGLGVVGMRSMRVHAVLSYIASALRDRGKPHGRNSFWSANVARLCVTCHVPSRLQVDGDSAGERSGVVFRSAPAALRVAV